MSHLTKTKAGREARPTQKLFTPVQVGPFTLTHRVVMAPLTRSRSEQPGDIPGDLMLEYYTQRASEGGLIISEGTSISIAGRGWFGAPGMYSDEQVAGWKRITSAIHAKGSHMFSQLWHEGRSSHVSMTNGAAPVAPSIDPQYWLDSTVNTSTPNGWQKPSPHRMLDISEIPGIVEDYRKAAERARDAGFDGVELHAANGYLPDQFLQDGSNKRMDGYGLNRKPNSFPNGGCRGAGIGVGWQSRGGANWTWWNMEPHVGQQLGRSVRLRCPAIKPVRTRISPHH